MAKKKKENKKKKTFVLDTNVILHSSNCIHNFEEHDVVVPMTALEELDTFKKGNDSNGFQARRFARYLKDVCGNKPYNGGFEIGPNKGKFKIALEEKLDPFIEQNCIFDIPDRRILNTVYCLDKNNSDKEVWLITKDSYMFAKAQALGLRSDDYNKDNVGNIDDLYEGFINLDDVPSLVIEALGKSPYSIDCESLQLERPLTPNEFFYFYDGGDYILARFDPWDKKLHRVEVKSAFSVRPRNPEQIAAVNVLLDSRVSIVTLSGEAGTGKTLLAIAAALEQKDKDRKILIARPTVPIKDEGFLPGGTKEKAAPFMKPIYDNLDIIKGERKGSRRVIEGLIRRNNLEIEPLSFIRGRSIQGSYFIIDEAQNLSPEEVKTIISRAGEGTKMIFVGDIRQIDNPYLNSETNGLSHIIKNLPGQDVYAHVKLTQGERSHLANIAVMYL